MTIEEIISSHDDMEAVEKLPVYVSIHGNLFAVKKEYTKRVSGKKALVLEFLKED